MTNKTHEGKKEKPVEGWEERIDKFLETGLKANFVQKAIFGEQIKTILRSEISESYQRGLHESAIKVDKEMMAFLRDHNESGSFLKKLTDEILASYKEELVREMEKRMHPEDENGWCKLEKGRRTCSTNHALSSIIDIIKR